MNDVHDLMTRPLPEPKPRPIEGFGTLGEPKPPPSDADDLEC